MKNETETYRERVVRRKRATRWYVAAGITFAWSALAAAWFTQWNLAAIFGGLWLIMLAFLWGRSKRS